MPTYRNITDNEVAVGLPVTQQLIQTMRDNIEAIFQGDATAPEVQWQALSRSGTPAAGNALILQITTELNADDTSVFGFGVRKTGTYRVRFEQRVADTPDTDSDDGVLQTNTFVSQLKKTSSGTTSDIGSSLTTAVDGDNDEGSNSFGEKTQDVPLTAGDIVFLDVDQSGEEGGSITLSVAVNDASAMWGVDVYGMIT